MLHVHAHEEFNHFAKALLATFLGLLMALGLESCHQELHQRHVAKETLESVVAEAEGNLKALHALANGNKDVPENLGKFIQILESLQDARTRKQPWHIPDNTITLKVEHTGGSLKSSAWTMALADKSFQRFPKEQANALADLYQQMGRLQAYLDQPVDYTALSALRNYNDEAAMQAHLERFSPTELEHFAWSLRQLKARIEIIRMWAEGLENGMKAKPRLLDKP